MTIETILIVDDEELIRMSLADALVDAGYNVLQAQSGEHALAVLEEKAIDVMILDLVLPGIGGFELLKKLKEKFPEVQVIVITAFSSIETAVESIKLGAFDYLPKPFNLDEVVIKVKKALEDKRLRSELEGFRTVQEIKLKKDKIVYKSKAMEEVIDQIKKVAISNIDTVLVTGETGTGKELVAKAIHLLSDRANKPFVIVNSIAVPSTLLESELFGYEKGAFTNACEQRKGLIEQAEGGTLFLDEIGDMDMGVQGKLLRFVEDRIVRRIGGRKEKEVDVRLIAATNKDLAKAAAEGTFRLDFLHRLNLVNIHLPPLRERRDDIPVLAEYFLNKYNKKHRKKIKGFTEDAIDFLLNYHWPGNVRELKNMIEQIVVFGDSVSVITSDVLKGAFTKSIASMKKGDVETLPSFSVDEILFRKDFSFKAAIENFSRQLIRKALKISKYNKAKAAKLLKMDRSTLNYQIKILGINDERLN
ncbi:sigma-54-dependent Fis family transcriptional regulator [Candidatus Micrarchaeota archaeon]|nr:MAG: sigma-54-dependent Fis family transcriptional regulator [Candidatus Micrarchaeota archaeon]